MADGRTTRSGRTNALDEARELVTLLGSLSERGDAISATTIAARLGVTIAQARKLIDLLVSSGSQTQEYLPLATNDDDADTLVLISSSGLRGRPLRLTKSETIAINAALNTIGVPQDDPLRSKLRVGLSSDDIDEQWVQQALAPIDESIMQALSTSVQALLQSARMTFLYRGSEDLKYAVRIVCPLAIRRFQGHWYVEAFDAARQGMRTFRIDRMRDAAIIDGAHAPSGVAAVPSMVGESGTATSGTEPRSITLVFLDRKYLDLFAWPGLQVISEEGNRITAQIPYYENHPFWLTRRIAACGGDVQVMDERIMSHVAKYAKGLLSNA